jgi:tetratricopeptide (TPR) repeat protein
MAAVGLAHVYSAAGREAEAQKILRDLERKLNGTADSSPYTMATIYAGLGQKDKAFAYFDRAIRARSLELSSDIKTDPSIDSLRSDPRFQTLVSQIGFQILQGTRGVEKGR